MPRVDYQSNSYVTQNAFRLIYELTLNESKNVRSGKKKDNELIETRFDFYKNYYEFIRVMIDACHILHNKLQHSQKNVFRV